ncbi:50S ribosomal protein L4 [bacterium]|jgi:large subunit ribosomal protein L4|nr:50S ribosomal protein L4 [bacterium]
MASLTKINIAGEKTGTVEVNDTFMNFPYNPELVHDCVVAQLANKRQGNASTLTKSEVNLTKKKPFRQKGTGNARAGYFASPVRRGGGIAHGPHPRSYELKINKKQRRIALYGTIAQMMRDGSVSVISDWNFEKPQTKVMAGLKKALESRKLMLVGLPGDEYACLSTRNIENALFVITDRVNVFDLVNATEVVLSEAAYKVLEERFLASQNIKEEK